MKEKSELVPLNTTATNVKSFQCGKKPIDDYLHRYAAKNMALGLSCTFVLPYYKLNASENSKSSVAAFYTLARQTLSAGVVPTEKKLPGYPVPVVLVAQLGVKTLLTALFHAYSISNAPNGIPSLGVVVDAIDEEALSFYKNMECFLPFDEYPLKLFIPMATIGQLFSGHAN